MKYILAITLVATATTLGATEPFSPTFDGFVDPGPDWQRTAHTKLIRGKFAWRHFQHSSTGDIVACVAWYAPGLDVDASAIRQASIETITSDGYAFQMTRKLGQPIADTIRHQNVSITTRSGTPTQTAVHPAIEYTYVYENGPANTPPAMAHGYVVVVGDFAVFVQHTATHVIASEIAQDVVSGLLVTASAWQVKGSSDWSTTINRPDQIRADDGG